MEYKAVLCAFLVGVLSSTSYAQVRFNSTTSTAFGDLSVRDSGGWLNKPECQEFARFNDDEINTYGVVVLKEGQSALELYGNGTTEKNLFKLWSVSKTFTALWLGTEIQKGRLTLDTPVARVLPELGRPQSGDHPATSRDRIRLRHLWTFSSGLEWCETDYCNASPVLRMMYDKNSEDAYSLIVERPLTHAPGRNFNYSSADVILISALLQKMYSPADYAAHPGRSIFGPLGIDRWVLKRDAKGLYRSGAELFLSTRDTAKLGQLILQQGQWAGRTLIPKSYMKEMTTTSRSIRSPETSEAMRIHEGPVGGLVWLNEEIPGIPQFLRRAPLNTVYTNGAFGQFLMVFPSARLVIARNGGDYDFLEIWNTFVDKALACFAPDQLRPEPREKRPQPPPEPILPTVQLFNTVSKDNLTARMAALEYCDCLFVGGFDSIEQCDPMMANDALKSHFKAIPVVDWKNRTVSVRTEFQDPTGFLLKVAPASATAEYRPRQPQDGCRLR